MQNKRIGMKTILSVLVALSCAPVIQNSTVTVSAETDFGYYPMQCSGNQYEVDTIANDGSFQKVACTADLGSAKSTMYAHGNDAVIRHAVNPSPTHIISMVNGIVYSYPQRDNSNTVTLTQFYNDSSASNKSTYVTYHREMAYEGTWDYNPASGSGTIGVTLNGFTGYISLRDVDLVPMKYVANHIALWLGGNQSSSYKEDPFLVYPYQGYYKVEQNGNYLDLVYHCASGWADPKNGSHEPEQWSFSVGPAADWMRLNSVYYSKDGVTYYSDRYYGTSAGTYYGYYQFLPLRTASSISASTFNAYLSAKGKDTSSKLWDTGQTFLDAQNAYGVNALLVFSIACLESGYGTSQYARERNNLFGWNAFDSDPNQASYFASISQAIQEHMGINLRGYLDTNDTRFFGPQLGNKGSGINVKYAADPYWGMKIASIAYDIDKVNNGRNGNLTDNNSVSVGLIQGDAFTDILSTAGGSVLYNTQYGARYQKNHMVAILREQGDWYQIQSTDYLENGRVKNFIGQGIGCIPYDWNSFTGWVKKSSVTRTNAAVLEQVNGIEPTGEQVHLLTSLQWKDDGTIAIQGSSYRPGIYVTAENKATQTLTLTDASFQEVQKITLTTTQSGNDGLNFTGSLATNELENGVYFFTVTTEYSQLSTYNDNWILNTTMETERHNQNGKTFQFSKEGDSNLLKLTVSDLTCGDHAIYDATANACVCVSGFESDTPEEGCSAKPTDEEGLTMMRSVEKAEYLKDGHTIHVSGVGFLQGMNATAEQTDIVEQVYLVDMETKEEIEVPTTTSSLSQAYDFFDGYDYSQIAYDATLDLYEVEPGNYYLKLRVTNGEQAMDSSLAMTIGSEGLDTKSYTRDDGYTVLFNARPLTNYRLEVNVEKSTLDRSIIQKPTRSNSIFSADVMKLKEAQLTLSGYIFMNGTSYGPTDTISNQLILVQEESGETIALTPKAVSNACSFDITGIRGSSYDLSNACYSLNVDLSSLEEGTYRMYMDTSSGKYRDLFELYCISAISMPTSTTADRTYSITRSEVRSRFILTIAPKEQ